LPWWFFRLQDKRLRRDPNDLKKIYQSNASRFKPSHNFGVFPFKRTTDLERTREVAWRLFDTESFLL
ncbi:hypothetical protein, partial [Escherichia coli]|uniref:hypothetical protein n=1 Tax=Escherichia coli TaxID=562 RepID=UPI00201AE7D3